ncbi:hypothetical protein BO79DRAFT_251559 [Aspergillus costaricaensis CBS 115574]|uniref:Uncharacterized protein n=1 Tax=Aspergillus costaricaensis CBS 115574 TaxID=1448317 RepID=A0ACD1IQ78_9EURO|nr:hypothetical protein BO79DRAFT_251559 [Aspergillus costaricaensis CBS 115574]RAK92263.1 hypothetical protein BO79DRAFT_251559 [Aspergillus costaricaensis CBS 115574]
MAGEDWPVTREITPPRSPPKERWCWDFAGLEGREAAIEKQVSPLRVNRDQSSVDHFFSQLHQLSSRAVSVSSRFDVLPFRRLLTQTANSPYIRLPVPYL